MVFSLHGMGPKTIARACCRRCWRASLRAAGATIGRFAGPALPSDFGTWCLVNCGHASSSACHGYPGQADSALASSGLDWSRAEAFVVFCDLDGYIRINLRGRERDGIVLVERYRPLCDRIAEACARSGMPIPGSRSSARSALPRRFSPTDRSASTCPTSSCGGILRRLLCIDLSFPTRSVRSHGRLQDGTRWVDPAITAGVDS